MSAFVLENVQTAIPITGIEESFRRDVDIGRFRRQRYIRARGDEFLRRWGDPKGTFLRRDWIGAFEDAHARVVVRRENRFFAAETARTVFMQVVRAECATGTEVAILRRWECRNRHGILRRT